MRDAFEKSSKCDLSFFRSSNCFSLRKYCVDAYILPSSLGVNTMEKSPEAFLSGSFTSYGTPPIISVSEYNCKSTPNNFASTPSVYSNK